MKYLLPLLLSLACSTSTHALEPDDEYWEALGKADEVWFSPIENKEPLVGYITHDNKETLDGFDYEVKVLKSKIGDITVEIVRTYNIDCDIGCPDTINVLSVPDGYVALPTSYDTPENEISNIEVYRYFGG